MSDSTRDPKAFLGTYSDWVEGFDSAQVDKALADQMRLRGGRLRDGQEFTRTTPSGLTQAAYDNVRASRDTMDTGDWNSDTGYSGLGQRTEQPGMSTEGERRRWRRTAAIEEGF